VSISFSLVSENDFLILDFAFPDSRSLYSPQVKRANNHLKQKMQELPKYKGKAFPTYKFGVVTGH